MYLRIETDMIFLGPGAQFTTGAIKIEATTSVYKPNMINVIYIHPKSFSRHVVLLKVIMFSIHAYKQKAQLPKYDANATYCSLCR